MRYAFDIGGSNTDFAVFANDSEVIETSRDPTPTTQWADFSRLIARRVAQADRVFGPGSRVGMSLAGVLNPTDGKVLSANVPCLSGRRVGVELEGVLERPVDTGNDADCFTMAEAKAGAGQGHAVVAGIIIGTGTGGGLVVNGRLICGHSGFTGEWGHGGRLADDLVARGLTPLPCGCGVTGCLDPYASGPGLERIHNGISGRDVDCPSVLALWQAGDEEAGRAIDLYLDVVSRQLALVAGFLDPDVMPVGGGVAANANLIQELDKRVRGRLVDKRQTPLLVPGVFVEDGCLRGAAMLEAGD